MNARLPRAAALVLAVLILPRCALAAQDAGTERIRFGDPEQLAYVEPYFPGARYDASIPAPEEVLGQRHGTRLSHHAEVNEYFRRLAAASPRVLLERYALSHEGRELVYAVITSERNHARLDALLADLARLADPRGLAEADARALLERALPVAWMAYSIHGDELSGTDAALALAHHLAADQEARTAELLDSLVVVIDPCQNPDGRQRILSMVEQSAGYTPNLDYASMQRGRWPWGRGNHYLFDMNRDWMAGTQPETRGRWRAVRAFRPQLFVDAHEMGSLDTYLFYPQAAPINPAMHERLVEWQSIFAGDIARAFDRYGWSYYTREWADGWAPFYSDAWSSLTGAIGILYEQARTSGFPLRRASGELLTYREAVHHQAVASLANLHTLAARRAEVLASWAEARRRNVAPETPGNTRVFVVRPSPNRARERVLLEALLGQGIEVYRTLSSATGRAAEGALGQREESVELPVGSLLVPARQPERQLVRAFLDFDQRLDKAALQREREELERKDSSRIYDITAWSLAHALDLDAWWVDEFGVDRERIEIVPAPVAGIVAAPGGETPAAWLVDGEDDASVAFAARALEAGLALHVSDEPFRAAERAFPRGSLLLRRAENPGELSEVRARIERAALAAGVEVFESGTARSPDEGPDLGGGHFRLLARPRIALLANAPIAPDSYGHLWHHLDRVLGVPFTILDSATLRGADLRRYNVLVLPPGGGLRALLEPLKDSLVAWVESGGTLVACGSSSAALTKNQLGLSSLVLRGDVVADLGPYTIAARRQRAARTVEIDEELVWSGKRAEPETSEPEPAKEAKDAKDAKEKAPDEEPKESPESLEAWRRRFSPHGVTLLAHASPEAWITAGTREQNAVYFSGSEVLLSKDPVAVRLGSYDELRLAGLLWPEARERIAESAYLAVERRGAGQVVLFAAAPAFRGYHHGSARLFSNAVIYGPGLGADQPVGW